ncbi:MAG: IS110 family transposase [Candidatus Marinimicrobia bacterium]|nr:IS110 family transposase [Candidatus Neomarinimicrobiota bacterium]
MKKTHTKQSKSIAKSGNKTGIDFTSFIGVDLHKTTVTLRAVDPEENIISSLTIDTKCVNKIEDWLNSLPKPRWMAVETVSFVEWFIDRYRNCVERIDIADATELANRRGKRRKNDRNDSLDIAVRLVRGNCPLGYIADEPLMQLRKLGRHWRQLSKTLSRAKHSMKSIFHAANIRGPKLDAASAQKWLLARGDMLKNVQRQAFADFIDIISLIERQRESLRRNIIAANRRDEFSAVITMLKSIPGIADIWACIIAAEVGPFDRFPNADALEFWAGLTPDNKESAGRTQSGKITKAGSATLRWALCKAAVTLCKSDAGQEAARQRLIKRTGKAKANVAMGRRLLRIIYAMMRDGCLYECKEPTNHLKNANKAKAKKRKQKEAA